MPSPSLYCVSRKAGTTLDNSAKLGEPLGTLWFVVNDPLLSVNTPTKRDDPGSSVLLLVDREALRPEVGNNGVLG